MNSENLEVRYKTYDKIRCEIPQQGKGVEDKHLTP